jgi:SOS-response transcriptional repressor LexA
MSAMHKKGKHYLAVECSRLLNRGAPTIYALQPGAGPHYIALVGPIGERIRSARRAKEWRIIDLAESSGVSERQIVNIENGANSTFETLEKLAGALGIPLHESGSVPSLPRPSSTIGVELPDGLRIVEATPRMRGMPVVAYVAAGHGGWEDASGSEVVMLPEYLLGPDDFLVQCKGDSMIDENIEDGDFLIVTRRSGAANVTHGDLIIAWLNDGLVIKRWYRRGGKKFLESANEEMGWKPREITPDDVFDPQAVVKHIVKHGKNKGRGAKERIARSLNDG